MRRSALAENRRLKLEGAPGAAAAASASAAVAGRAQADASADVLAALHVALRYAACERWMRVRLRLRIGFLSPVNGSAWVFVDLRLLSFACVVRVIEAHYRAERVTSDLRTRL